MSADNGVLQQVACKAVIARQGKILVLRESKQHLSNTKAGLFQLPGGRIDPGEPFADGLVREVKEETGLLVTPGEPFFIGEWFPVIRGRKHQIVAIFFTGTLSAGKVVISDEHDDYKWIDPNGNDLDTMMEPDREVVIRYGAKYL